jgi:hypothetical protein
MIGPLSISSARSRTIDNSHYTESPMSLTFPSRLLGIGVGTFGVSAGIWLVCPALGIVIVGMEAIIAAAVVTTALYASDRHSRRAFRLLRWAFDRSEPPVRRH